MVPAKSEHEFVQQMKYNRKFISTLPGYIKGEAFKQANENGELFFITTAFWENENAMNQAKEAVMAEFKRIGFNPLEFYQRLNIKLERGIYNQISD